ncbi:MAG: nuclear transport factor 2 family protein [Devosia sp.]
MSQDNFSLPTIIRRFVAALNSFDEAALLATLADDAFINDAQREFWGKPAIAAFMRKELIGPKVTMAVTDFRGHHELLAVDAWIDGEFDKAGLPHPLILTFYFTIEAGLISTLFIMRNRPASETLIRPQSAA